MIKRIDNKNILNELKSIGFDEKYVEHGAKKHSFITLKITNLPPHIATIIKESALSKGTDAGVNKNVLMHKINSSDLILSGTIKQLNEIKDCLYNQPFGLKEISKEIEKEIKLYYEEKLPKITGILNVTENSFSDGGKYLDFEAAITHANDMIKDGAKIIDIGAESTRPNAKPIDCETEIKRLAQVVKELKKTNITVSIDTRNHKTAEFMLNLGADIINDVSGLEYDKNMINVIKNSKADIIIMHSRGTPETMDKLTEYKNITDEIYEELYKKIEYLNSEGIESKRIIIDTGFGFAKNIEQNFELLKRIREFNSLNVRHLAGVSRKRFLQSIAQNKTIEEFDDITMLTSFYLMQSNVDLIRVHNVKKTKTALELYKKLFIGKDLIFEFDS